MKPTESPLATAAKPGAGFGCILAFGLLFILSGLAVGWFFAVRPVLRATLSLNWEPVPCEILSSRLDEKRDSDGSTYRVEIHYRYVYQGRRYVGERYDFGTGYTNIGVGSMRDAVRSYRPGSQQTCRVDPARPDEAVLSLRPPPGIWLGLLFGLLFPAAGAGVIWSGYRARRQARAEALTPLAAAFSADTPTVAGGAPETPAVGEVVIKPASGRLAPAIALGLFATAWNTGIGFFLFNILRDFDGGIAWFFVLFQIPFVLVGLLLLFIATVTISQVFAPRMELRLDPSLVRLGARVPFRWRFDRGGITALQIHLEGREEATYRQGTSTATDRREFHRAPLLELIDRLALAEGRAEFTLPVEGAAPTLAGKNNRVVWQLVAKATLPWRPSLVENFPLTVLGPPRLAPGPADAVPVAHRGGGLTLWVPPAFAPGETLVGNVARDPGAPAGPLTLRLGWFTEGRGTRDAGVVWTRKLPDLAPGADLGFEVPLPAAPWTFGGALVSVEWRLEVLDPAGAPLVAAPVVIAPGGVAVVLQPLAPAIGPARWKQRLGLGR